MAQTSTVNDIIGQARQGSVAAIIQVLNERFADDGIRTRAILADGILQLLCEAPTAEQLPQSEIVSRVQNILESLSPRHIRKVNINSRIVREQQLLWLEEITRDPDGQLLWSELITLKQPNPLTRFWQDIRQTKAKKEIVVTDSKRDKLRQKFFWRGLVGGASLCLLLVLVGWTLKHRLGISWTQAQPPTETVPEVESPPVSPTPPQDTFAQAVRLAQQTAQSGQTAETPAEWLELAAQWQRASDLMAEVPPTDDRYNLAQDRVAVYQQYSDQALAQAENLQQTE
ncbi:MAG: hypothetical protein AAFW75_15840 [Cyanobacteria bacterium J06636_16]